jgi:DNA polymerase-3 subunit epsilon
MEHASKHAGGQLSWDELDIDESLSELTFVIVDLETTGGPATEAGITEIGAVKVRGGGVLGEFATLVEPGGAIPAHIQTLTGITNAMVCDAPSVAGAVASFGEFAGNAILVAHNAPYDLGFLKAACARHDLTWFPGRSLDTARLARVALHAGEVRNCKLATLAQYFHSPVAPEHRALADARATTHVLHHLLERVGSFGVYTWADLRAFVSRVSKEQRAKRHLADGLPNGPGVYTFVDRQGAPLYVGTSRNVRTRVRNYFTAAETRARMTEMIGIAERVDAIPCATALEAQVRELRLIAQHQPRYNRRSRRASTSWWIRLSEENAPRLVTVSIDNQQTPGNAWGPFRSRAQARAAVETIADVTGLRTCTGRLPIVSKHDSPQCLRGHLGSCPAPCTRNADRDAYGRSAEEVRAIVEGDLSAVLRSGQRRMAGHVEAEDFELAAQVRDEMHALVSVSIRFHRIQSIVRAGVIVAAAPEPSGGWDIHVISGGRLVAAARALPKEDARAVARAARATAEDAANSPALTTFEETALLARWIESPDVRLVSIDTAISWPVRAGSTRFDTVATNSGVGSLPKPRSIRPVGPAPGTTIVSRIAH